MWPLSGDYRWLPAEILFRVNHRKQWKLEEVKWSVALSGVCVQGSLFLFCDRNARNRMNLPVWQELICVELWVIGRWLCAKCSFLQDNTRTYTHEEELCSQPVNPNTSSDGLQARGVFANTAGILQSNCCWTVLSAFGVLKRHLNCIVLHKNVSWIFKVRQALFLWEQLPFFKVHLPFAVHIRAHLFPSHKESCDRLWSCLIEAIMHFVFLFVVSRVLFEESAWGGDFFSKGVEGVFAPRLLCKSPVFVCVTRKGSRPSPAVMTRAGRHVPVVMHGSKRTGTFVHLRTVRTAKTAKKITIFCFRNNQFPS